ncbi:MAG: PKD domain-containing protein [Trueperaceae bacterium]|nr:MAG: PKD domain-containing protein [Trueperaceae bacterium]
MKKVYWRTTGLSITSLLFLIFLVVGCSGQVANQDPVATFSCVPTAGTTETVFSFDASASGDPDGTIASYAWTFGDGTSGSGAKTTHQYAASGTYTVELTITDDRGATAKTSESVAVANQLPTAVFTVTPAAGTTDTEFSFDANASGDPDGTLTGYAWDFGDGTSGSGATTTHQYVAAGTFTVTLTITDNDGATAVASQDVTVTGNQAPTAAFTVTPAAGTTETVFSFDASASGDPDGTIASYAWTFGDGTSGSGAKTTHQYAAAGTFTVTLTITDNDGATAVASQDVTVTGNQAPTAAFTVTPAAGTTETVFSFDASASGDPDGTLTGYAWTFGDGTSGSGATTTHQYVAAGTFTVTLTITDNGGATDTASADVTVTPTSAEVTTEVTEAIGEIAAFEQALRNNVVADVLFDLQELFNMGGTPFLRTLMSNRAELQSFVSQLTEEFMTLPRGDFTWNELTFNWEETAASDDYILNWTTAGESGPVAARAVLDWNATGPTENVESWIDPFTETRTLVEVPTGMSASTTVDGVTAADFDLTAGWFDDAPCTIAIFEPTNLSLSGNIGTDPVLTADVTANLEDTSSFDTIATTGTLGFTGFTGSGSFSWNASTSGLLSRWPTNDPYTPCRLMDFTPNSASLTFTLSTTVSGETDSFGLTLDLSTINLDFGTASVSGSLDVNGVTAMSFSGTFDDQDGDGIPGENITLTYAADSSTETLEAFIEEVVPPPLLIILKLLW